MTSRERTFSSDLSTDSFSSTDNLSSLSVSCLRAATRSLVAFLAISLVRRARTSSSSGLGAAMSLDDGGGVVLWAKPGSEKRQRMRIHTKSLSHTETSQRAGQALLQGKLYADAIRNESDSAPTTREKTLTTEDTEEH